VRQGVKECAVECELDDGGAGECGCKSACDQGLDFYMLLSYGREQFCSAPRLKSITCVQADVV
jgi:hypothetical protein